MKRLYIVAIVIALVMGVSSGIALAACGKVTIGEMNWPSAQVLANVEKFILEKGYGCEVEIIQTTTVPCMTSMVEKGEPDIASEIWMNSVRDMFEKGVADGRVVKAGKILPDGAVEAWYVPAYLVKENPKLKSIKGILANAQVFKDPENPKKGRFYNCPSGWACKIINNNLFRAYGMEKDFVNFDPGSSEGLAGALAKAYEQKEPWLGYYWDPTPLLGKYDMVRVELGEFDPKGHACNAKEDCDKPHAGQYPPSEVFAATTKAFADSHPEEMKFIEKIGIPNKLLDKVLAWGDDNKAEGDEIAGYFMVNHEKLWTSWLPADVAAKVKKALKK